MDNFKFKPILQRVRMQEKFDKEKITITKAGQTYNVYDFIQEQREDTELYPTLEKYNCIPQQLIDTNKIYDDFTAYNELTLRDLHDQNIKANEMFYQLPTDVRKEFNNNINEFVKNGYKWIKNKINEETKEKEKYNQQIATEAAAQNTKETING